MSNPEDAIYHFSEASSFFGTDRSIHTTKCVSESAFGVAKRTAVTNREGTRHFSFLYQGAESLVRPATISGRGAIEPAEQANRAGQGRKRGSGTPNPRGQSSKDER